MKMMDCVELIAEKSKYAKEGVPLLQPWWALGAGAESAGGTGFLASTVPEAEADPSLWVRPQRQVERSSSVWEL